MLSKQTRQYFQDHDPIRPRVSPWLSDSEVGEDLFSSHKKIGFERSTKPSQLEKAEQGKTGCECFCCLRCFELNQKQHISQPKSIILRHELSHDIALMES